MIEEKSQLLKCRLTCGPACDYWSVHAQNRKFSFELLTPSASAGPFFVFKHCLEGLLPLSCVVTCVHTWSSAHVPSQIEKFQFWFLDHKLSSFKWILSEKIVSWSIIDKSKSKSKFEDLAEWQRRETCLLLNSLTIHMKEHFYIYTCKSSFPLIWQNTSSIKWRFIIHFFFMFLPLFSIHILSTKPYNYH